MEPQPSILKAGDSGGSVPAQQQQLVQLTPTLTASFDQCHQLFEATCHVKLERCQVPIAISANSSVGSPSAEERLAESAIANKAEEDSDVVANEDASSSEDDIKPFPHSRAAVTPSTAIKVKKEKDSSTGSESSSENDEVKVFSGPEAGPSTKKRPVTKKKTAFHRKLPVHCTVCKKRMSSNACLKIHMRKHSGEKRYRCEKCGRSFWSPSSFAKHKKIRDQRNGVCPPKKIRCEARGPNGKWTCEICGKSLKTVWGYYGHVRVHRDGRKFHCKDCGKGFGRKYHLVRHQKSHKDVWQFSCVFCEKGFHQKTHYFAHLRVHTEEKPYCCVVDGCGKEFGHLKALKHHRRWVHLKKY